MYLLLGSPHDLCCAGVHAALAARGSPAHIVENLLSHPARWSWWLDSERSSSQLAWDDRTPLADDEIEGVLVRDTGWLDPAGWQPKDLLYMQAEAHAALLGWLWSLPCPVLNRYPPATWYRPQLSLLSWWPLLWRSGLPALETLVTNVPGETRAFGERLAALGVPGAIYRPLTTGARYLVANEGDWAGLAALQLRAPVCLAYPHAQPRSACVVGERVVWDGSPPPEAGALEPALRRFAVATGLAFVEVTLAAATGGLRVVEVEPHPKLERFGAEAQGTIVAGLVELLATRAAAAAPVPGGAEGQEAR
jgi:hypothetical protein